MVIVADAPAPTRASRITSARSAPTRSSRAAQRYGGTLVVERLRGRYRATVAGDVVTDLPTDRAVFAGPQAGVCLHLLMDANIKILGG